jgi:hypothetical protein
LSGGIDYVFPAGISLAPGEHLLVVDFDPVLDPAALAGFRGLYGISTNIEVYGPFSGNLNNGGDEVGLNRPDRPQSSGPDTGFVPYVLADRVAYDNAWPWPIGWVDGGGHALQRSAPFLYGNEPLNWFGGVPSPGMANSVPTEDTDGDGIPDLVEIGMGLNPDNPDDGAEDPDKDGASNYEEYVAGTGHLDPESNLHFIRIAVGVNTVLTFEAVATKTYSILYKDALLGAEWTTLSDVSAPAVNRIEDITDTNAGPTRFYILVTPAVP